jgi:hypothetical protein
MMPLPATSGAMTRTKMPIPSRAQIWNRAFSGCMAFWAHFFAGAAFQGWAGSWDGCVSPRFRLRCRSGVTFFPSESVTHDAFRSAAGLAPACLICDQVRRSGRWSGTSPAGPDPEGVPARQGGQDEGHQVPDAGTAKIPMINSMVQNAHTTPDSRCALLSPDAGPVMPTQMSAYGTFLHDRSDGLYPSAARGAAPVSCGPVSTWLSTSPVSESDLRGNPDRSALVLGSCLRRRRELTTQSTTVMTAIMLSASQSGTATPPSCTEIPWPRGQPC